MVQLSQHEFELVPLTLSASLRKQLQKEAEIFDDQVRFGDDVASDVYTEMMEFISLHEMTLEYDLTSKGRELEAIAKSIFEQSGG